MKKWISALAVLALVFSHTSPARANAGPTRWGAYPTSSVLTVEADTSIQVDAENLVFDFTANDDPAAKEELDAGWTLGGRVSATYDMSNPTNRFQRVQMAFPFVGNLASLGSQNITVEAGGKPVAFDIYPGSLIETSYDYSAYDETEENPARDVFDFDKIVAEITDEAFTSEHFTKNEKGKLYTFTVTPTLGENENINYALDYTFDPERTNVVARGFNGFSRRGMDIRNTAWCRETTTLELFVLGDDIEILHSAYLDGEETEPTDAFTSFVSAQPMSVYTYAVEHLRSGPYIGREESSTGDILALSDAQVYNAYAVILDRCFSRNAGYASDYDLSDARHTDRIITLVYSVDFPAGSSKSVRVSYNTYGSMDMRKTSKPMYTFDYILNPAGRWSAFKDLNITVLPPKAVPFIIQSNVEFERQQDGTYVTTLEELPENDLRFTLYESAGISLGDRIKGSLFRSMGYLYPLVIGFGVVLAGFVILVALLVRYRRKRRQAR
jgi:hypothetical protein